MSNWWEDKKWIWNWGIFDGIKTFFGKIFRVFDKDLPDFFTKKEFEKPITDIPPGAILIFRGNDNLVSSLIRKITKKWANHVGLYFGSGKHETIEALGEGVVKSNLERSLNDKTQIIIAVKKDLKVEELMGIKGYAYGCVGKKYDYLGLADFLWDDGRTTEGAEFCSRLVVESYEIVNIKISKKPARETSPGDILTYILSEEGFNNGFIIWDSRNILLEDIEKIKKL